MAAVQHKAARCCLHDNLRVRVQRDTLPRRNSITKEGHPAQAPARRGEGVAEHQAQTGSSAHAASACTPTSTLSSATFSATGSTLFQCHWTVTAIRYCRHSQGSGYIFSTTLAQQKGCSSCSQGHCWPRSGQVMLLLPAPQLPLCPLQLLVHCLHSQT